MSYRDYLARKGYAPLVIERTKKRPDDLVLKSWALPVERHRPRDQQGRFVRREQAA